MKCINCKVEQATPLGRPCWHCNHVMAEPPLINWGEWKGKGALKTPEALDKALSEHAVRLGRNVEADKNRFVIVDDHMILVAKDRDGNVRTFKMRIEQWNYRFAAVHQGEE